jgi:hypothetical protein
MNGLIALCGLRRPWAPMSPRPPSRSSRWEPVSGRGTREALDLGGHRGPRDRTHRRRLQRQPRLSRRRARRACGGRAPGPGPPHRGAGRHAGTGNLGARDPRRGGRPAGHGARRHGAYRRPPDGASSRRASSLPPAASMPRPPPSLRVSSRGNCGPATSCSSRAPRAAACPAWLTRCVNSGKRRRPNREDPPECCSG